MVRSVSRMIVSRVLFNVWHLCGLIVGLLPVCFGVFIAHCPYLLIFPAMMDASWTL